MKKLVLILVLIFIFITLYANIKDNTLLYLRKENMPNWIIVIFISSLPIFELRGGIPVAINIFKMDIFIAYLLAVIGNLIPVIPILLLLEWIYNFFSKWTYTKKIFDNFFERTKKKSGQIKKYKIIGLIMFVAIPLPVTGAWTGAAASVLLGMNFWESFVGIFIGVLIAGIIVTIFSIAGMWGAISAGIILLGLAVLSIIKSVK